jgi:hypothetical protein
MYIWGEMDLMFLLYFMILKYPGVAAAGLLFRNLIYVFIWLIIYALACRNDIVCIQWLAPF